MKCPHCLIEFHPQPVRVGLLPGGGNVQDADGSWSVVSQKCPKCNRVIVELIVESQGSSRFIMVHPKSFSRAPLPPEIPNEFGSDYREACRVFVDSPKASAALSRRCLQHILREAAKTKKKDLADQIDEVLPSLPVYFAEMIDMVRVIGNFAAHPTKSTNSGEIIDVEPGEAESLLDTLETAFEYYFVQPAITKRKRDAINQKLAEAGKPPLK